MENLKINKDEITFERTKKKWQSEIKYKTTIINHGDHISISKLMIVDGVAKSSDLTHIPNELLDKIVEWVKG